MNPLIAAIFCACTAYAFVHLTGIMPWVKNKLAYWLDVNDPVKLATMKLKPFDCHTCLAFWLMFLFIAF